MLLSITSNFVEGSNDVTCKFYFSEWTYFKRILNACRIEKQIIDNAFATVSSTSNLTVEAFDIRHEKGISFIPMQIPSKFPQLVAFQIFNCSIKSIGAKDLKGLKRLRYLNMPLNEIATIDKDAFQDLCKLEYLSLASNDIESLSSKLFSSLENLKTLFLNDNEVEVLSPKTFSSLKNLESLFLTDNNIYFLHENTFANLFNLGNISFNNNNLEVIDKNLLRNSKKLEYIWLNDNNFKFIDSKVFDGMSELKAVNLLGNICINKFFYKLTFEFLKTDVDKNCIPVERQLEIKILAYLSERNAISETCNATESILHQKLQNSESKLATEILKSRELEKKLIALNEDRAENQVQSKILADETSTEKNEGQF